MQENKNLVQEALIQMKNVEEAIAENAKGILASTMKEEINQLVKESLSEQDDEEDQTDVDVDTDTDNVDVDMDGNARDNTESRSLRLSLRSRIYHSPRPCCWLEYVHAQRHPCYLGFSVEFR